MQTIRSHEVKELSLPEWMWIIIAAAGVALAVVVAKSVWEHGIKAKYGRGSIIIEGTSEHGTNPLGRALQYVKRSSPEIQHLLFKQYLKLIKKNGADPDYLADYDDSRFVRMLLRYLVNGGNGSKSIQQIIEHELVYGDWRREGDDLRGFVESEIWPPIVRSSRDLINSEYDTEVLQQDGNRRRRWASNTEFADMFNDPELKRGVIDLIVPYFQYARRCLYSGCADEEV